MPTVYPARPCTQRYTNEVVYVDIVTARLPNHEVYIHSQGPHHQWICLYTLLMDTIKRAMLVTVFEALWGSYRREDLL